jgi:hypothetical protein
MAVMTAPARPRRHVETVAADVKVGDTLTNLYRRFTVTDVKVVGDRVAITTTTRADYFPADYLITETLHYRPTSRLVVVNPEREA